MTSQRKVQKLACKYTGKTKILHNNVGYGSRVVKASVAGMDIEVLAPSESTVYLGKALSFTNIHEVELRHRMKRAWAKYGTLKKELLDHNVPLRLRLRLFQSVVTPSALYGCSSWVLTEARANMLQSTQLRMIRNMLGKKRRPAESWVEWLQRVTPEARDAMQRHGVREWTELQKENAEKWSRKI